MEKKQTKRALQAQKTKKRIYEAGVRLFQHHGYEAVSVNEIAKQAKVGIGSFYHYYPSTLELYLELFVNAEDYFAELQQMQEGKDDPEVFFQKYFDRYRKLNEDPGIEFASMLTNPANRRFLKDNIEFELHLQSIIEKYQRRGLLVSSSSAEEIREYLFLCARGVLFDWTIHYGEYDLKTKMDQIMKLSVQLFLTK